MAQRYTHSPWGPPPLRPAAFRADSDLWALTKQIDELGGEWTFNDFVERSANFHHQGRRINFYEHTGDWDELTREAFINQRAREFGLPPWEAGTVRLTFRAFPSVFNPVDGAVPMPAPSEPCIGEHSARLVAVSTTELLIQHGWSGWTPTHTATLSRDYFDAYATGGVVSRPWNRGPSDATTNALYETSSAVEFRRLWETHKPAQQRRISHDEIRLRVDIYPTWSLQACRDAAVISLTIAPDIRVGVAVLVFAEEAAQISDLFVWPPYRRRGFGALLERLVSEEAAARSCSTVELYLWKSDSIRGEARARAFMTSRTYTIDPSEAEDSVAIGHRPIAG